MMMVMRVQTKDFNDLMMNEPTFLHISITNFPFLSLHMINNCLFTLCSGS